MLWVMKIFCPHRPPSLSTPFSCVSVDCGAEVCVYSKSLSCVTTTYYGQGFGLWALALLNNTPLKPSSYHHSQLGFSGVLFEHWIPVSGHLVVVTMINSIFDKAHVAHPANQSQLLLQAATTLFTTTLDFTAVWNCLSIHRIWCNFPSCYSEWAPIDTWQGCETKWGLEEE